MEQVGRYRVLELIGRGGMGAVFKARAPDGATVAIKLPLLCGPDAVRRRRFQREAEALLRVRHPNVVRLLEVGESDGQPFLALEWVEGESLEARIRRAGPLEPLDAADMVRRIALAIEHCHGEGVLHRDLKPDNVLIRAMDDRPLLVDFGLTRDVEGELSQLSRTGASLGTPGYWSPEQALGRLSEIGPRTDVFGLGALLFSLLTGHPPVDASTFLQALNATNAPPRSALVVNPRVPAGLDAICQRAMATAPVERYSSAQGVAEALERWAEPAVRRPRRNSVVLALSLLAVGGAAMSLWRHPREATEAVPLTVEERLSHAYEAWMTHDLVRAIEHADAVLAAGPSEQCVASARLIRAQVFKFTGDREQLDHELERLGAGPTETIEAALIGFLGARDGRTAARMLDEGLARHPEAFDLLMWRCRVRAFEGDFNGSLQDADRAIALRPTSALGWGARGLARHELGDTQGGLEDLEQAILLGPTWLSLRNRALLRSALGDERGALEDYTRSLELRPEEAQTWHGRGNLRLQRGDAGGADDLSRALELSPRLAAAYQDLGKWRFARKDFAGALKALDGAIEVAPGRASAHLVRAQLHMYLGNYARAVADLDRSLTLDPKQSLVYIDRSFARFGMGDLQGACEDATIALQRGENPSLLALRGRARWLQGDTEGGLLDLDRSAALNHQYAAIWTSALTGSRVRLHAHREGEWPGPAARFLLGELDRTGLLAAADLGDEATRRVRRSEARCYLGIVAEREGDEQLAREELSACVAERAYETIEHQWAAARLRALSEREVQRGRRD